MKIRYQELRALSKFMILTIALWICYVTPSYARDVTLGWDPNSESDLAGYKIYYKTGSSGAPYNGTGATEGSSPIDVGNVTQFTVHGLGDSETYYLVATAYNGDNLESDYSNEVNISSSSAPPSIVGYPTIDYGSGTFDITFSEANMQNATTESNYGFSPSLLFKTLGGSDDILYLGNNTYRLSMAYIPANTIFTLTVSNITDGAGNPVSPSSIKINDSDNNDMADDWETDNGVEEASGDIDGDGSSNLEEYNNGTDPNNADTDGDGLPDGWEVTYGLDPNDSSGVNGRDGDYDHDGWTNYEEYVNSYDPSSTTSPAPAPPEINRSIPHDNAGITRGKGVPANTSFAVLIASTYGIDITDTGSVDFTINDGENPAYERNLSETGVVRVVKLTSDADTQVTKLWAVYDRSNDDEYGNAYGFAANVNVKVDVKDRTGTWMAQASYAFGIESEAEQVVSKGKRPHTNQSDKGSSAMISVSSDDDLNGFQMLYDPSEPVTPYVNASDEIPAMDIAGVTPVGVPLNLGPPTVFNNPVTLIVPCPGEKDARDLNLYLYDGFEWVYASGSYNTGGEVQSEGDGWMVPGSLVYDTDTSPQTLGVQVYHFSAIQAGYVESGSVPGTGGSEDKSGGGGGCFITSVVMGSDMEWQLQILRDFRDERLLNNSVGRKIVDWYYTYSPDVSAYLQEHSSARTAIGYALVPLSGAAYLSLRLSPLALSLLVVFVLLITVYCLKGFVMQPLWRGKE